MARDPNRRITIIDGASQLFLLRGYDGVTVDQICSHTSSAKGSFYHFFRSKEDLAVQLVDEIWSRTERRMEETFAADHSPRQRIELELEHCYKHSHTMRGRGRYMTGCPIGSLSITMSNQSEKIRKRINFAFTHMRHFYLMTFEEGIQSGEFNSHTNAQQRADLLLATVQGVGVLGRNSNSPGKIKSMIQNIAPILTT